MRWAERRQHSRSVWQSTCRRSIRRAVRVPMLHITAGEDGDMESAVAVAEGSTAQWCTVVTAGGGMRLVYLEWYAECWYVRGMYIRSRESVTRVRASDRYVALDRPRQSLCKLTHVYAIRNTGDCASNNLSIIRP